MKLIYLLLALSIGTAKISNKLVSAFLGFLFLLVLIIPASKVFGQLPNPNGVPPSPQVSSLGNYIENDVTSFTGKPNITLPLYTVKTPNLSLPISISYSTDDIKIESFPGNAGFGWSLNAGGAISSTFYGPPDAYTFANGGTRVIPNWADFPQTITSQLPQWAVRAVSGDNDLEPDIFFFSFPGGGGKFVLDDNGAPMLLEKSQIKVEQTGIGSNGYVTNDFIEWVITDDQGVKYYFGGYNSSSKINGCLAKVSTWGTNKFYANAWYLRRIESPFGDYIDIYYDDPLSNVNGVNYYGNNQFEADYLITSSSAINQVLTQITGSNISYIDKKIKEIRTSTNEVISFTTITPSYNQLVHLYETISISGKYNIVFTYSKHNNSLNGNRPRLDEVLIGDHKYTFSYNDNLPLPPRGSFAQDLWGYYNGKSNNQHLIPTLTVSSKLSNSDLSYDIAELQRWGYQDILCSPLFDRWIIPGSNREVDPAFINVATLKSITLPTGGQKIFEFEPHDFSWVEGEKLDIKENVEVLIGNLSTPEGNVATQSFSVQSASTFKLRAVLQTRTSANNLAERFRPKVTLLRQGSNSPVYQFTMPAISGFSYTDETYLELTTGNYTLELRPSVESYPAISHASINRYDILQKAKSLGGGLRVKSISFVPENGSETLTTHYNYSEEGGTGSNGFLYKYPVHMRVVDPNSYVNVAGCNFRIKTFGYSQFPITSLQGPIVAYRQVEIKMEGSGKSVETYNFFTPCSIEDITNAPSLPAYNDKRFSLRNKYPFLPFINDYLLPNLDNNLNRKVLYHQNGDSLLDIQYNYSPSYNSSYTENKVTGLKIVPDNCGDGSCRYYIKPYHIMQSLGKNMISKRTEEYYPNNGSQVSEELYFHESNRHNNITRVKNKKSDGTYITKKYYYPDDFNANLGWINNLRSFNIKANPIVEQVINNGLLLGSDVYEYKEISTQYPPFIDKHYSLESPVPMTEGWSGALQNFNSHIIGHYCLADYYNEIGVYGRILEKKSIGEQYESYYWGHNGMHILATFSNMSYSELSNNSTLRTQLDNLQNIRNLHLESSRIALSNLNETIRNMLPSGVVVTTYTYEPNVGVTSITDPNGITTFYEYDGLGRLQVVRDHDGNILKKHDYNYSTNH